MFCYACLWNKCLASVKDYFNHSNHVLTKFFKTTNILNFKNTLVTKKISEKGSLYLYFRKISLKLSAPRSINILEFPTCAKIM